MTSPTIRIRLANQPPLYFVAAVVVASLLPLLFQLMPDASSVVALQRLPKLAAAPVAFERIADHAPPGLVDIPVFAVLDAEVEPPVEETADDVVIVEPEPRERAIRARSTTPDRRDETPTRRAATPRPGLEQRGKAACAAGNKSGAREVYRALPIGDERRRSLRKACRDAGILIL